MRSLRERAALINTDRSEQKRKHQLTSRMHEVDNLASNRLVSDACDRYALHICTASAMELWLWMGYSEKVQQEDRERAELSMNRLRIKKSRNVFNECAPVPRLSRDIRSTRNYCSYCQVAAHSNQNRSVLCVDRDMNARWVTP